MIFVTVGTQLPFDRLIKGVDLWAKAHPNEIIFGQTSKLGPSNYHPQHFNSAPRLDPPTFDQWMANARVIVAHAGTGSLIGAMTRGKPILVMPRLAEHGEHRNDHQLATVDKFGSRAGVRVAQTPEEVGPLLDQMLADADATPELSPHAEPRLLEALSSFIHQR